MRRWSNAAFFADAELRQSNLRHDETAPKACPTAVERAGTPIDAIWLDHERGRFFQVRIQSSLVILRKSVSLVPVERRHDSCAFLKRGGSPGPGQSPSMAPITAENHILRGKGEDLRLEKR